MKFIFILKPQCEGDFIISRFFAARNKRRNNRKTSKISLRNAHIKISAQADGELKAPTNYEYFVLGNATDGYVVTVNMSKKTAAASTDTTAE